MKFNAIVIGLGNIGLEFDLEGEESNVFSHTKAYLKHSKFNLVAGIDNDEDKRKVFENYTGIQSFSDIFQLKKSIHQVDIVSICTPSNIRLSLFKDLISLKPKLIIIEKPIALTLDEAYHIKELADQNNVLLYINYMRRVDPFFIYLKNTIEVEKVRSICINYTNGLYTNASHFVDLMHYLFGIENNIVPLSLKSKGKDYTASFVLNYDNFHVVFNGLEDIEYSLGSVDIILKEQRITIKDWGFKVDNYNITQDPLFPELQMLSLKSLDVEPSLEQYMLNVIDHIYKVLNGESQILSTIDSSINTLRSCDEVKNASYL